MSEVNYKLASEEHTKKLLQTKNKIIEKLKESNKFYADKENWYNDINRAVASQVEEEVKSLEKE